MSEKPHPAAVDVNGKWYLRDAKRSLVPIEAVKSVDLLIDELVRDLVNEARDLRQRLAMAATKPLTQGDRLRIAAEQLLDLADRFDTPGSSLVRRQRLHDDTETVAGDVRAVVRGRGFQ